MHVIELFAMKIGLYNMVEENERLAEAIIFIGEGD
jgi:hypothetical protein